MKSILSRLALTLLLIQPLSAREREKQVLLIAGRDSHGGCCHEHTRGTALLARALNESGLPIRAKTHTGGWPKDESIFEGVDAVVIYCDGGGRHVVNPHLESFDKVMKRGVGLGCIHYGVEVPKGPSGDKFLEWIGGYFETHWSVNPHWVAEVEVNSDHPVGNGVEDFKINDEWYFHMRFRPGMAGVTPIFSAVAPDATMKRKDGAHSGNPHVRKSVAAKEQQHVYWVATRPTGGRGFGITGGHFHKNWGDDNFRKAVLNGIVWIAQGNVPKTGVPSEKPTDLGEAPQQPKPEKKAGEVPDIKKAAFASKVVNKSTPGHAIPVEVELKGAKKIFLVVDDAGDGYGCDWASWVEPRFETAAGEKKLTDLKWTSANSGHGQVRVNRNSGGGPLKVAGQPVSYGVGVHANSIVSYDVPSGATRFRAKGALDNGGTDQGCGSTVRFMVFLDELPTTFVKAQKAKASGGGGLAAEDSLATMTVPEGVEARIFASEPDVLSVSNMDIDHLGRVWVCDVVNYRRNNGKRPEGDRILILEDTDSDGVSDKETVFYQGRDIDSALGICVLDNKVIVSVAPNVFIFTDENRDGKADRKEVLFTRVGRPQHDHSTHAFVFGPDGKLYWNVGNTGIGVSDKNGEVIVDMMGNEVLDRRKPYIGGMVFRCDMDGSNFETLGHNFRNNYEVTVDSFGNLWQSDNDDDGNKGVRINFVMEFGNYGYRDELTGAGWKDKRTNIEADIPKRHWHQNDPGVVPNLLLTGSGSPCGICLYEGDLLPEVFRGQMIHAEAGHNVARAYPVKKSGAGYTAEMVDVLKATDRWVRPSDVCTAPDGSLFVADWYDPGVGGHGMRDLERGRIFRIAPPGSKYQVPEFDASTVEGAIQALRNPNLSARYLGWTALHQMGSKAIPALKKMTGDRDSRMRARAFWLLGKIDGSTWAVKALADRDEDIRIVGVRLARQLGVGVKAVKVLVDEPSPQVRRECAIALHGSKDPAAPELWAELAMKHDGKDRWYLEALGIGASGNDDACYQAWKARAGSNWNNTAGRDIVWRSRSKHACADLAEIVKSLSADQHPRYMRAFDFHKGPEKDKALAAILGL